MKNNVSRTSISGFSSKHLRNYSLLAGSLTTWAAMAEAQVIYTDINPDIIITTDQEYLLDLNNDGIADFRYRGFYSSSYYTYKFDVDSFGLNRAGATYENIPFEYPDAFALGYKEEIGPLTPSWWNQGPFEHPSMNGIFGIEGLWSPNEQASIDKFMGLQLEKNGSYYYGWVRLSETADNKKLTIKDYALHANPGQSITAGEGIGMCIDSYEKNNNFPDAEETLSGNKYGIISSATDKDVFKIRKPFADEWKLKVTLSQLPKDYDLYLYDGNYNLLNKSINPGTGYEVIKYIIPLMGSELFYYARVVPKGSDFDPFSCYLLNIELELIPFYKEEAGQQNENNIPVIHPNPVSRELTLHLPESKSGVFEISILNTAGKLIYDKSVVLKDEQQIDLAPEFPADGIYFVTIRNEAEVFTVKFLVNRFR